MPQQRSEVRVRYAETDAMGVAHHANYPVWFEVGRGELMHALGLPYAAIEARGFFLMLTDLEVKYRRAARYDDLLTLVTQVAEIRSRTLRFEYTLLREEEVIATGVTRHIITDQQHRPARMPQDVMALLGEA